MLVKNQKIKIIFNLKSYIILMIFALYFSLLISISLNYIILNYIDNLERIDCNCSDTWRSKFIKFYSTYLIVIQTFIILVDIKTLLKFIRIVLPFYLVTQILGIFYLITIFQYSSNLKKSKCKCSNKWERDLMYYYSLILITVYLIIFLVNILYLTKVLYNVIN